MRRTVLGLSWLALLVGCHAQPKKDGMVTVNVHIRGRGQVVVLDANGWCEHWCTIRVARGTPLRLRAVPEEDLFARWTGPCSIGPDCFFAPLADVTLDAQFGPDAPGLPWLRPTWAQ